MDIDEKVGTSGVWVLPVPNGEIELTGVFLGVSSLRAEKHALWAHKNGPEDPPTGRCGRCRWSEFRIFREEDEGKPIDNKPYFVHFSGMSVVPGETARHRVVDLLTAREVVEVLTTRKFGKAYLSAPAGRALAQAASFDEGPLQAAYDTRRVA